MVVLGHHDGYAQPKAELAQVTTRDWQDTATYGHRGARLCKADAIMAAPFSPSAAHVYAYAKAVIATHIHAYAKAVKGKRR